MVFVVRLSTCVDELGTIVLVVLVHSAICWSVHSNSRSII
jgi:hypothetical protein